MNQQEKEGVTTITAKEYLQQYRTCERDIGRILDEISLWETRAARCTSRLNLTCAGMNGNDKLQQAVDALADLRDLAFLKIDETAALRQKIEAVIDAVGNKEQRLLLKYRYIDGLSYGEIAHKMSYSRMHIYRLHKLALLEISLHNVTCDL